MNKKPIIAFLYDFDKTLCTTDMQDYTFIPSLGYTPGEFWSIANSFGFENRMDGLLAYMYTMIEECRKKGIRLDRDYLVSCGHAIELFPGVQDWFSRINAFGETLGVEIEHYVLSSGLREIIEGSGVSHEFKEIYACEFFYNEEGLASWPKLDVNFTNKTQFVYRINKGILDVAKDKELNASMPDDSKRIPFTNMIYIGDGLSDVPCMKMMRAYGGQAVAVYQDSNRAGVEDLLAKGRVDFIFPADYRDGTLFDETMKNIVRKIAIADALAEENQQQLRSLGRSEVPQQVGLFCWSICTAPSALGRLKNARGPISARKNTALTSPRADTSTSCSTPRRATTGMTSSWYAPAATFWTRAITTASSPPLRTPRRSSRRRRRRSSTQAAARGFILLPFCAPSKKRASTASF